MNIQVSNSIVGSIYDLILELKKKEKISHLAKLKDFSPWLSNFIATKQRLEIEIPGQYTGDQKPSPHRHVYISQFGESVLVMPSIRKPVKLTIIGSDTKSYNFLVKFGEDLRQDERVQQMLGLMNRIFHEDQYCHQSHLLIKTYKVVPLSSCLGVIEWVDNTSCLKDLMTSTMTDEEKSASIGAYKAMEQWVGITKNCKPREVFGKAYVERSREESIRAFRRQVDVVPMDVLRRGIMAMSSSYEAFYTLRHHFITSYSTLCVAHWILGIGDRHLSNCLVSLKDCCCIGIDFGHVFGTATQFLPVPELVPFRLTPHIVSLMLPLDDNGLVKESMVHCLQALRTWPELLMATMQVFILEPTLDWLLLSSRQAQSMGETDHSDSASTWLPKLKVQQARQKLEGVNPIKIVGEDLEHGHQQYPHCLKGYLSVLGGDVQHNVRAQLPGTGLSPRQQVECLIDLAMDFNVLSKSWLGWQAWM